LRRVLVTRARKTRTEVNFYTYRALHGC